MLRDFLADAVANSDRVDEGNLVAEIPGLQFFACAVDSPNGALLE